jgi:arylsulfatase A-like enzyme
VALLIAGLVLVAAACTSTPRHGRGGRHHRGASSSSPVTSPIPSPSSSFPPPTSRPNIVLILTDDQTLAEMGHMQTVQSQLQAKGVTLENGFVVNPLCCPSRTTILTGKYSHSTGVYRNIPPHGGFQTFGSQDRSTIATWLHAAGYATALVGKYLNGYGEASYVPPGWDTWDAFTSTGYTKYQLSQNGRPVRVGPRSHDPNDYSTTVLGNDAAQFIRSVPAKQPLFLYFAPKAPHADATPDVKYRNALTTVAPYRPPNFNEPDVSDKPAWLRNTPPLTPQEIAKNDTFVRHQLESLLSVDDQVSNILGALAQTHRLSRTFILFASDNGLENGAHRLLHKGVPYEEAIHVPMVVRYDPITQLKASESDQFALNVDFAPTFAAVAGIAAPGAEGTSLLPIIRGHAGGWRTEFVVEHVAEKSNGAPTFCAVRTTRYAYIEYADGSVELYDLSADPAELNNLANTQDLASVRAQLRADDARLCSPRPPGWPAR